MLLGITAVPPCRYFSIQKVLVRKGIKLRNSAEAQTAKKKRNRQEKRQRKHQNGANTKPPKAYHLRGR